MTLDSSPSVNSDLKPIRCALLSVTDKTGLIDFARALASHHVELVSTGGTAKALRDAGLAVRDISDLTGFPEMLDGRVKTLHPRVHGGILHIRSNPEHVAAITEHAIQPIDMVVVNLYAFEKTAAKPKVAFHEIIENIDIGGPSMVRSAAKNFGDVAIVTSAADYPALAAELASNSGSLGLATRWRLAQQAFATTAAYDAAIATALESITEPTGQAVFSTELPKTVRVIDPLLATLRYGENPHQRAAVYTDGSGKGSPTLRSSRARSSATTTSSISMPAGSLFRSSTRSQMPPRSSSSTPTPAELRRARRSSTPTAARSRPILSLPSVASSASTER